MKSAKVSSSIVVVDKKAKRKLHEDTKTEEKDVVDTPMRGSVGIVKTGIRTGISASYQSVTVEVAVELPWPCRPGHVEDLQPGFDKAYEFLDDELAARAKDMEGLLKSLVRKYGH